MLFYSYLLYNPMIFLQDKDEEGKPMGLGLSIVGGSDTLLGAIFIHEVYQAGESSSLSLTIIDIRDDLGV